MLCFLQILCQCAKYNSIALVIAEIIPSTDDTCLHQSISPQNGPSKVNCTSLTGGIPNLTPANHQCESIASILPVVSTIIATVCRTLIKV